MIYIDSLIYKHVILHLFAMKNGVACGWSDILCIREGVGEFSRRINYVLADKNLCYIVLPVGSMYLWR